MLRHPEKFYKPDNLSPKKPPWIRVKAPISKGYSETKSIIKELALNTVCEEAACPNIGECWEQKHATVMILGDICTRACAFCNIKTGKPLEVDSSEPDNLARAVSKLGLKHIVITSVDRDDLRDGGAFQFVFCIEKIRELTPDTTIEILTPDFLNKKGSLRSIINARPDVFNHNLETVPRLYKKIRPGARYHNSLRLLEKSKKIDPSIFTKSGIMVGLGEMFDEVIQVMDDLRFANVDFLTIGQYLQPTLKHAAIKRFITPSEFNKYKDIALSKGFLVVASSPLTRSSYHADEDFKKLVKIRKEQLSN